MSSKFAACRRLGGEAWRRYVHDMCGRARLSSDVSEIKLVFSIPPERPTPNLPPSWNVRFDAKAGQRSLDLMRWGLVPNWAKDIKVGFANINAKAEGIETKPAFRKAFERRRCLVPVDISILRRHAQGRRPHGARRFVGELAFANRRMDTQLCDHHHYAERIVRQAAQPHAGRAQARSLAGLARRGAGRPAAA
jgi:hypothetical protein